MGISVEYCLSAMKPITFDEFKAILSNQSHFRLVIHKVSSEIYEKPIRLWYEGTYISMYDMHV